MHRLLLAPGDNEDVDHRDGNGLNNKKENLRKCSRSQNLQNQTRLPNPLKSSAYKGVYWDEDAWRAQIRVNKQKICLGYFTDEQTAALAYNEAANKYFGEFARPNLI